MKLLLRSEELVLLAVFHLEDNAYGVTVRRFLMKETGQRFSYAAIYEPLDRLTSQGFLKAEDGRQTKERGGRRRRMFRLSEKGRLALAELQKVNEALWDGVPDLAVQR